MKRIAVALLFLAACGGKSKPMAAQSPTNTGGADQTEAMPTDDSMAPGGGDPESDTDGTGATKGAPKPDSDDPCGGDD